MRQTLRSALAGRLLPVCCLHPTIGRRPRVPLQDAARHPRIDTRRRHARAVRGRRQSVNPGKTGGERADAVQTDHYADICHRALRVPQQRRGPLQPTGLEVLPRRLPERAGEHPAEMRPRQPRRDGQVVDGKWLGVSGIDQILCPQQIACRGNLRHGTSMACALRACPCLPCAAVGHAVDSPRRPGQPVARRQRNASKKAQTRRTEFTPYFDMDARRRLRSATGRMGAGVLASLADPSRISQQKSFYLVHRRIRPGHRIHTCFARLPRVAIVSFETAQPRHRVPDPTRPRRARFTCTHLYAKALTVVCRCHDVELACVRRKTGRIGKCQ